MDMLDTTASAPESGGTTARNEVVMLRFYDALFKHGDLTVVGEIIGPTFVDHISRPMPGQPYLGPEAITWFISLYRTAFPDLSVTVEDILSAEDRVVARVTWRGTQTGPLLGASPTGKKMQVEGIDIGRFEAGKLVEHWGQIDVLTMIDQLGFLPTPGR